MKSRNWSLLIFLAFATNSDICRTVGFPFCIAKASGCPEAFACCVQIQFAFMLGF
jgi:hypothetical protein